EEHRQALREALAQPALFAAVLERYAAEPQVPRRLHHVLVRDHGITDAASGRAAEIFLRSARYAGVLDAEGRMLTPSTATPGSSEEAPSVGSGAAAPAEPAPTHPSIRPASAADSEGLAQESRGGEAATQRFEISLGAGRRAVLELPAEMRPRDLELLRKQLEVLELQVGEDDS
ncbi:MAG: hypothetical protein SX243_25300, partial [Acidobacteriota bacterium]|nr:hypothetical protein [Acidobacteriota bacterium]